MLKKQQKWKTSLVVFIGLAALLVLSSHSLAQTLPGGTLNPTTIPKYVDPLPVQGVMPKSAPPAGVPAGIDYYEIAVRQFKQQILPAGLPLTKIWSYGSKANPGSFAYPAFRIEARADKPVRIKWSNELVDKWGNFLPHILPIDQTLHWANPPGGLAGRDSRGTDPSPYKGPVPIVSHLHGAHVGPESDGYPEAWWLPAAKNIPTGYAKQGSAFGQFDPTNTKPGTAVFQYPNDQRAATLWYHDHALGMTRANVYAGPIGFYVLRGGPSDLATGLPSGKYEVPIAIQDKSFNTDGSLFYPKDRAFFEGLTKTQLKIPFIPSSATGGPSDVSPIWNPEFFANTMVANGKTWPVWNVERRRYRVRFLNGCDSRFMILKLTNVKPSTLQPDAAAPVAMPFWQIGNDGGFLPAPVMLDQLLMGPAERADVIIDFSAVPQGTYYLTNEGPDSPFGGGTLGVDYLASDSLTTRQVIKIVVGPIVGTDQSTPPANLVLPDITPVPNATNVRQVSLNENESATVFVPVDANGAYILDARGKVVACNPATFVPVNPGDACVPFGPTSAMLGTVDPLTGMGMPMMWMDAITENPTLDSTEIWEIHNFTMDAHPIHLHLVQFEVLDRQMMPMEGMDAGMPRPAEAWEAGTKDTVIAYPGEITRVKAKFDRLGRYVWHCHILSHEDNEMMRPFEVIP